jgi:hypothetical protein
MSRRLHVGQVEAPALQILGSRKQPAIWRAQQQCRLRQRLSVDAHSKPDLFPLRFFEAVG